MSGYRGSTISNSFFNAGARLELAQSKDSGKGRIDPTDSNCQYWHGAVCGMVVTSNRFSCSGTTCASINISHAIPAAASIYVHGNTFESSNASVCSNKHSCFGDSCKTLFGRCDISKSDGELTSKSRSHLKSDDAHGATTCDITTFGAAGDNKTDNTASIQRAIEACTRKGAATVIPAGGVYMSGPLLLPSHCTLQIEPGATLIASPDYRTWPNDTHNNWCHTTPYEAKSPVYVPQLANFLYTFNSSNVTVTGGGVVDGQGWRWYPLRGTPGPDGKTGDYWHNCRPKLFAAWNATGLTMHNITLRNSPMYVVSAHSLLDASFTQVTIDSNQGWGYLGAPNTDGFNIQGENIYIGQSTVRNGDDCVRTLLPFSSNTGRTLTKPCLLPQVPIGPPSRNVLVEDLVCERGNGVVPIIWSNPGTIEDVVFRRVRNVYTKR